MQVGFADLHELSECRGPDVVCLPVHVLYSVLSGLEGDRGTLQLRLWLVHIPVQPVQSKQSS